MLEKKLTEMRVKHNDAVQRLKAKFLEDKNAFEEESETQLKELSKEAKKVWKIKIFCNKHCVEFRLFVVRLNHPLASLSYQLFWSHLYLLF